MDKWGGVNSSVKSNCCISSSYINSTKKILKTSILCLGLLCFSLQGKAGIVAVPINETETTSETSVNEITNTEKIEQLNKEIQTIYDIITDKHSYSYMDDNGKWENLTAEQKIKLLKNYIELKLSDKE